MRNSGERTRPCVLVMAPSPSETFENVRFAFVKSVSAGAAEMCTRGRARSPESIGRDDAWILQVQRRPDHFHVVRRERSLDLLLWRQGAMTCRLVEKLLECPRWRNQGEQCAWLVTDTGPAVRDVARREHGVASRQVKLLPADFKSIFALHDIKPFVLLEVYVPRRTAFALIAVLENVELALCVSRREFVRQRQQTPDCRSIVVKSIGPYADVCPLPFWSECIARNDLLDQHSRPDAECYFTNRCLAENAL